MSNVATVPPRVNWILETSVYVESDRSVLLLFKKGATADTDANGAVHIAFGIARSDLPAWERWLKEQDISIELRKMWKYGGEAPHFRDPDGHLLEVVIPGVGNI